MARTPFLGGALAWLCGGEPPAACPECGYSWSTSHDEALALIGSAPDRLAAALEGRDGSVAPPDGSWNATAYVWHLADIAQGWAERWRQLAAEPGSALVPWDTEALAEARGYRGLHPGPGLWAVRGAVARLLDETAAVGSDATFRHPEWGEGTVADAIVWLGHEFRHHEGDVRARVRQPAG